MSTYASTEILPSAISAFVPSSVAFVVAFVGRSGAGKMLVEHIYVTLWLRHLRKAGSLRRQPRPWLLGLPGGI